MKLNHRGQVEREKGSLEVRPLTRDDLPTLAGPRLPSGDRLKKLRESHHRLARYLAVGLTNTDAAVRAGYTRDRVQVLLRDPAFVELVQKYSKEVSAAWLEKADDYADVAIGNMIRAERMISDRLDEAEDNGELPPVRELIAISRDAADRFGYGKTQTNVNANVDFAAKLEATLRRSGMKVIDGKVVPLSPPAQPPASSAEPTQGEVLPPLPSIARRA